jgi:hypothetical protein
MWQLDLEKLYISECWSICQLGCQNASQARGTSYWIRRQISKLNEFELELDELKLELLLKF